MCICMRSTVHLCTYKVYSEEQNTCLALVNSTCKHYHRLKNDRNSHHIFPSLLSTWHPLHSTKMAVNNLNQVQRPVQAQIQHLQQGNMDGVSLAPFENLCQRKMCSHWQRNCTFSMSCKRRDGLSLKLPSTSTQLRATKAE